jgi:hypothetical protein
MSSYGNNQKTAQVKNEKASHGRESYHRQTKPSSKYLGDVEASWNPDYDNPTAVQYPDSGLSYPSVRPAI